MANNIHIERKHSFTKEAAKAKAQNIVDAIQKQFGVVYKWDGDTISFKADTGMAKGVSGSLSITETNLTVDVELPAMLAMMKGFVEKQVNAKLDEVLS